MSIASHDSSPQAGSNAADFQVLSVPDADEAAVTAQRVMQAWWHRHPSSVYDKAKYSLSGLQLSLTRNPCPDTSPGPP